MMSPVLTFSPFVAALVSAFVTVVVVIVLAVNRRRMVFVKAAAAGAIAFAIACPSTAWLIVAYGRHEGIYVSPADASGRLPNLDLPSAAQEVRYYWSMANGLDVANFSIDEDKFIEWARRNKWTLRKVYHEACEVLVLRDGSVDGRQDVVFEIVRIEHGWLVVHPPSHSRGLGCVFDADTRRVFVWFTTF